MVVDSDRTNFNDFVESVVEKYPPGYMEVAHIQYLNIFCTPCSCMMLPCELKHLLYCQLIIAYVCTWIIIEDFICILNSHVGHVQIYIKNSDSMLQKIIVDHFGKLLILSNLKKPYSASVGC